VIGRLRREEGGWAIVTAVGLMAVMVGSGLSLMTLVDAQSRETQVQRTREAAFNIGEAVLNDQVLLLKTTWPYKGQGTANAYPACTNAVASTRCPDPATIAGLTGSVDSAAGVTWASRVIDNVSREPGCNDTDPATACDPSRSFFSDATHANAPGYDANGDGALWVRSEATARGRTRRLLALVRITEQVERLTRSPVLTGTLEFSNNGSSKTFIVTGDNGVVHVRCDSNVVQSAPCLGFGKQGNRDTKKEIVEDFEQVVQPARWGDKYPEPKAMAADALERLRQTAITDGTYYTSCAQIPTIAGRVVWLEGISCSFQGSGMYNSPEQPGFLVVNGGKLELRGTVDFYGPIYAPNPLNSPDTAVELNGTATIYGGIIVDGQGKTVIGSSGKNQVVFDDSAFDAVRSLTSSSLVQSSFRELPASASADG
jgi:Tfp pilus assembly protein PilX